MMRNLSPFASLLSMAAVGVLALAGVAHAQGTIKIGMTSALTGPYNEFGEGNRRGVELAIEKWNKAGGINGQKIELAMLLDDQLVPDRAVQNMRRILDNKELVGIIGPAGSGPTLAVIDMAVADGRPYMNPTAQTPSIVYPQGTDKAPRKNVFSFALQNDVETNVLGTYVAKRFKKIGILHESTAYGTTAVGLIRKEIKKDANLEPVGVESYNQRAQDMTAQLAKLQRDGADVVVCVGLGADLAVIRRNMSRLNFAVPLIGTNGALSLPYQEGAGELVLGTKGTMVGSFGQEPMNAAAKEFADAYRAKYGTDRWWGNDPARPQVFLALSGANAYDAANVLFEGIRRAKSSDAQKIIQAIESIKSLQGVNAQYTFTAQRHHGIGEDGIGVFEYTKVGDKIRLGLSKD